MYAPVHRVSAYFSCEQHLMYFMGFPDFLQAINCPTQVPVLQIRKHLDERLTFSPFVVYPVQMDRNVL